MKKLLFIFLIIYSHSSIGENFKGVMTCKITNKNLFKQTDAKVKEYTGFKDEKKIGDKYEIVYQWNLIEENTRSFVLFIDGAPKHLLTYYFNNPSANDKIRVLAVKFSDGGSLNIEKQTHDSLKHYYFRSSEFSIGENILGRSEAFLFSRYYKSDWMGMIQKTFKEYGSIYSETIFLDCRHKTKDVFEEMFEHLFMKFDDPEYKYNE